MEDIRTAKATNEVAIGIGTSQGGILLPAAISEGRHAGFDPPAKESICSSCHFLSHGIDPLARSQKMACACGVALKFEGQTHGTRSAG